MTNELDLVHEVGLREKAERERDAAIREREKAWERGSRWSILAQELDGEWGQAVDWAVVMNALRLEAEAKLTACDELLARWRVDHSLTLPTAAICADELAAILKGGVMNG